MSKKVSLTGIKPTGQVHIGNYLGAIKQALQLSDQYDARYFIADYHALNIVKDKQEMSDSTYGVAATWMACGLDPSKVLLYRQSDVPETFELSTFLMGFTAKGLMNRAHAYKDKKQKNEDAGKDSDFGVNMGLYTYPVLMAADILLFNTDIVPVGKDQVQHVEITADIAGAINHCYNDELLTIPKPILNSSSEVVQGMDGRKMSKSYDNTIPLFMAPKKLRKLVMKIVTNSQEVEEVKDPETCNVFAIYKLFANEQEQEALKERYLAGGLGWGHAKQELFEMLEATFADKRERYDELMNDKSYLDKVLKEGAERAREISSATMNRLRKASGIGC
ncbi:MAG: tryptophan--tRNA ligase [Lentisphaeraceae bacterium]|nr:tryptophan--tRNA ligase [Lentisphaeraceae bacterium]